MSKIELFHGDCLEIMENIPGKSVDMILTDPPYGVTAPKWDSVININSLWHHYNRIIKPNRSILIFAAQPFTTQLIISNLKDFKYCWYWIKNQSTNFFHAKRMPLRKVEEICVFKKGVYYPQITENHQPTNSATGCSNGKAYFGTNIRSYEGGKTTRFPTNILNFNCVDNYSRLHSAEKPVDLLEYLIKTYTSETEIVLDSCMGSGSTGVACKRLNRNFIGIELKREYFELATNRIHNSHQGFRFQ